jgi:hypothetical protein
LSTIRWLKINARSKPAKAVSVVIVTIAARAARAMIVRQAIARVADVVRRVAKKAAARNRRHNPP